MTNSHWNRQGEKAILAKDDTSRKTAMEELLQYRLMQPVVVMVAVVVAVVAVAATAEV